MIPTTLDTLFDGALVLEQPAPGHGYRINVDSLWLARFAAQSATPATHVIDLGAGVGAVAFALHTIAKVKRLTLVEKDPTLAKLGDDNAQRLRTPVPVEVIVGDVQSYAHSWLDQGPLVVVSNPPYTPPGAGRQALHASRDSARRGELKPFLSAMKTLLNHQDSRAYLCYPVPNLVDALSLAGELGLFLNRMRFVHPSPNRPARLTLLEFCPTPRPILVLAPWFDDPAIDFEKQASSPE